MNLDIGQDLDREDSCLEDGELCLLVERQQERGGILEPLQEPRLGSFVTNSHPTLSTKGTEYCHQPQNSR